MAGRDAAFVAAGVSDAGTGELAGGSATGASSRAAAVLVLSSCALRDSRRCLATALLHPSRHPMSKDISTAVPITATARNSGLGRGNRPYNLAVLRVRFSHTECIVRFGIAMVARANGPRVRECVSRYFLVLFHGGSHSVPTAVRTRPRAHC